MKVADPQSGSSSGLIPSRIGIFENAGFWGEGKTGVLREKPLGAKERINNKGRVFWRESKNGFVISDHTDYLLPKKRKIRKRIIYPNNGMSSSWKKKQKQN